MKAHSAKTTCRHPPEKLFSWFAYNFLTGLADILCVGCCACGSILKGSAS